MKLIIVESPTKARTISKFLGRSYSVKSSQGHVRDLPKTEMGIDIENGFNPHYIVPAKARGKVAELKEAAKKAGEIILATDEDREGEAIAWHLAEILDLNKKAGGAKRIVFHEITKGAIEKALENPRPIDFSLVDAQQARRILDRLVGYELSPFLWKKVKRGLSAGRVQSVALRLIVEREREIEKFNSGEYWIISAKLKKSAPPDDFLAFLSEKNGEKIEKIETLKLFAGEYSSKRTTIENKEKAEEIARDLREAKYNVKAVTKKETFRTPPAPFITSTLQQNAINTLGFSSKMTMMVAQKLYEEGYITYMRTDSVNLSLESMLSAKKLISRKFGKDYVLSDPRFYKTNSKSAQEAHEAIRPTDPQKDPEELVSVLEPNNYRLYDLIWKRMIASQMQNASLDSVKVDIEAKKGENEYLLKASGSTLKFDGFLKVYSSKNKEKNLPPLKEGEPLDLLNIEPAQKFTAPPPRYNEASLVKVMEENGIGRPSTYTPTISTILERKYVDKNEEKKLVPLEIGFVVNDILVEHFPQIVDINFTAEVEEGLDKVSEDKKDWVPLIKEFYSPFHKNLESKTKQVKKEDIMEKLGRNCPECGGELVFRFGRFGKFIACSNFPNCKYTEKTEAEKEEDRQSSGIICEKCGSPMVVKRGKFGSFLGCSNYPNCKNIKKIENKIGMKCPKCKVGEVVSKKTKSGKFFYGCNKYPKCDFASWNKPVEENCPKCGAFLVEMPNRKIKCSNKECGYEK